MVIDRGRIGIARRRITGTPRGCRDSFLPASKYSMYVRCCTAGRRRHVDHLSPRKPDHRPGSLYGSEGRRGRNGSREANGSRPGTGQMGHQRPRGRDRCSRENPQGKRANRYRPEGFRPAQPFHAVRESSPRWGVQCSAVGLSFRPVSPRAGALVAIADAVHVAGSS
jgi:hypothetical protein